MTGDEIREAFLRFFGSKRHLRIPSSSLIPAGDPTLLLTNAGMVQFKPYFTGEMTPPGRRLTSVQKCFRTTDIDSVGDSTHLTFFEMLGNFSVGDYFKKEAIEYAWEFVTEHLKLKRERLWATVFVDDDEAFGYWTETGIPPERIRRFGEGDNFWGPAGSEGPCGPCSEIHYDFGEGLGCRQPDCGPNCENIAGDTGLKCDRFVELWNLVFMQFYQAQDGNRTPLPAPNIDTGMGLERCAVILQGKRSIYETDLFQPLVQKVAELCGRQYGQDKVADYAMRVVAEHARSAAFLISDGVVPGNEGRGYVLRRVIRRAIRFGRRLSIQPLEGWVLPSVADVVIKHMGSAYPELASGREFILRVLQLEEEGCLNAFTRGMRLLTGFFSEHLKISETLSRVEGNLQYLSPGTIQDALHFLSPLVLVIGDASGTPTALPSDDELRGRRLANDILRDRFGWEEYEVLQAQEQSIQLAKIRPRLANTKQTLGRVLTQFPGEVAFILYDTYGFPVDETEEFAREHGRTVDMKTFQREMEAQRERARAAAGKFGGDFDAIRAYQDLGIGATPFLGYETLSASSVVVGLLIGGEPANQATEGQEVEVVLRETPFYAEMGGQVGDSGEIEGNRCFLEVNDTQSPIAGLIVHQCTMHNGSIALGDTVDATVDAQRRQDTARNHTATHMLHAALRQVLGSHVRQHGSLVAPDRLRFDFTHVSPLTRDELREVQRLTNEKIRENVAVSSRETTYRQAVSQGALAFFGDRYGDQVRVVEVAPSTSPTSSRLSTPIESGRSSEPALSSPKGQAAPFSLEVCGGTHVHRTGDIGYCHVVSESSIGSGLRRIEAVTGRGAEALVSQHAASLEDVSHRLQVSSDQLVPRVDGLLAELEQAKKRAETLERELLKRQVKELPRKRVAGINVVSGELSVSVVELLREAGDWLKNDVKSGVVVLGTVLDGRPTMLVMGTADMVAQGFHAGNVVREAAKAMGGGGGGRPEMGQAGGRDPGKLMDALRAAEEGVRRWRRNVPK